MSTEVSRQLERLNKLFDEMGPEKYNELLNKAREMNGLNEKTPYTGFQIDFEKMGNDLYKRRKHELGLSRRELSEQLNLSQSYIERFENKRIATHYLPKIVTVLNFLRKDFSHYTYY